MAPLTFAGGEKQGHGSPKGPEVSGLLGKTMGSPPLIPTSGGHALQDSKLVGFLERVNTVYYRISPARSGTAPHH